MVAPCDTPTGCNIWRELGGSTTLVCMSRRFSHRFSIVLVAVLLQLHAVVVLAMPCGQCLPGDEMALSLPCHTANGAHAGQVGDATSDAGGDALSADSGGENADQSRCSHCASGACGSAVTALPPIDTLPSPSFTPLFAVMLLPPSALPGRLSAPYRPPIL